MPEYKEALAELEAEIKSQQKETSEIITKYGKDSVDTKNRLEKIEKDLGDKIDEVKSQSEKIQTAINRVAQGQEGKEESEQSKEFKSWLMSGTEGKSLSVGNDPEAGYLVSETMGAMFDETVTELSPLRQLAEVVPISGSDAYKRIINKKGGVGARWTSETNADNDTGNPSLGVDLIPVHNLNASVYATQNLIDDASTVESWLSQEATEDFSIAENAAFFSGSGVGRPLGLLDAASGLQQVNSGNAAAFTTDGILKLMGSVKGAYRANAKFMANRSTIFQHLLTLKDGEDRHFLVPDFRDGLQFRLVGTPLLEATDMPETAGDALPLIYGDFRRGYTIVDRKGIQALRDPYTVKPFVEFYFTKRVGGKVKVKEAMALQKISA